MVPTVEKVGRYEIVGELGRGAMGLVYRAVDPNIGRTVALKTMRLDVPGMEHDEMLRRFRYEAKAAGAMNHPNIVTIYDADEVDGLFYIAMEYLEGQTLQSLMAEKRIFPGDQIVEIAKQVAAGLDYARERNVIHRDIKPANIMITRQNVAKIMDFGISKSVGSMTHSGQVLGTPNYMAPEQVKGLELDARADLFSFGVVLYEMATGERPFVGQNVTTIIYKIVNENPIAPTELEVTVHPGISAVIAKCLAKSPIDRYQSGAELAQDIENYRSLACEGEITSVLSPEVRAQATQSTLTPSGTWRATAASAQSTGTFQSTSSQAGAVKTAKINPPSGSTTKKVEKAASGSQVAAVPARENRARTATVAVVALGAVLIAATVFSANRGSGSAAVTSLRQVPTQAQKSRATSSSRGKDKDLLAKNGTTAASSATGNAEIRLTSKPEGALVQIDGRSNSAWTTPLSFDDLAPGTHEVMFRKQGYADESRKIEVGPKSSSVHVNLAPISTALSVASDPPGAGVEIDGHLTGKVTPAEIPVAQGQHKIVVRLNGYRPAQMTANVKNGQILPFAPVLNPVAARQAGNSNPVTTRFRKIFGGGTPAKKGMIDFVTTPPGAKIVVNGKAVGVATPAHTPFPPGDYRVELREPGYKPVQKTVHVEAGKNVKVEVKLDPQ